MEAHGNLSPNGSGNAALRSDVLQAIRQEAATELYMTDVKKYTKTHQYIKGNPPKK